MRGFQGAKENPKAIFDIITSAKSRLRRGWWDKSRRLVHRVGSKVGSAIQELVSAVVENPSIRDYEGKPIITRPRKIIVTSTEDFGTDIITKRTDLQKSSTVTTTVKTTPPADNKQEMVVPQNTTMKIQSTTVPNLDSRLQGISDSTQVNFTSSTERFVNSTTPGISSESITNATVDKPRASVQNRAEDGLSEPQYATTSSATLITTTSVPTSSFWSTATTFVAISPEPPSTETSKATVSYDSTKTVDPDGPNKSFLNAEAKKQKLFEETNCTDQTCILEDEHLTSTTEVPNSTTLESTVILDVLGLTKTTEIPNSTTLESTTVTSTEQTNSSSDTQGSRRRRSLTADPLEPATTIQYPEYDLTQQSPEISRCVSLVELEHHKAMENEHLKELRNELDKIEKLMEVLKEQQNVLYSLNKLDTMYSTNTVESKAPEDKVLKLLKKIDNKIDNSSHPETTNLKRLEEEVDNLKKALSQQANITRLSEEMHEQKLEIDRIKTVIQDFIVKNDSVHARTSEHKDQVTPALIQRRINDIQRQVEEMMEKERADVLTKASSPTTDLHGVLKRVEEVEGLIDTSLNGTSFKTLDEKETEAIRELKQQKKNLSNLKSVIVTAFKKNDEEDVIVGAIKLPPKHVPSFRVKEKPPKLRSSDSGDLPKLFRSLEDSSEDLTSSEMDFKLRDIQRQLQQLSKKKKKTDVESEIRQLQKQIRRLQKLEGRSDDEDDLKTLMRKMVEMFKQEENKSRDLGEINREEELRKLQNAIDSLKPKETLDQSAQFQIMLNKLIAGEQNRPSTSFQPQLNQQQIQFLIQKLSQMQQRDYKPPPPPQEYYGPPPGSYEDTLAKNQQFFRGHQHPQIPPPDVENYGPAKLDADPAQAGFVNPYAKQRIEGLKTQIYGLQNVISGLNDPNYVKKPEDYQTISNLDREINDLKNIVDNLNPYPEGGRARKARSTNKKVEEETEDYRDAINNFIQKTYDEFESRTIDTNALGTITIAKEKLDNIKKELGMSVLSKI